MAVNSYQIGNKVICTGTFATLVGVPTDPDAALFFYKDASGVVHRDLAPTRTGTGVYTYTIDTTSPDTRFTPVLWYYGFYSPPGDSLQAAEQGSFSVTNPAGL